MSVSQDYNEQVYVFLNISVAEKSRQQGIAWEKFERNKNVETSFLKIDVKDEKTFVLWVANVILLFF